MIPLNKIRRPAIAYLYDLLMVPVAWFGAYWLRFNLEIPPEPFLDTALAVLPAVWVAQGFMFWYFGLYRGVWRFASVPDLMRIVKAVAVGVVLSVAAVYLLTRLEGVPRSVFILDGLLLVLLLGGSRFGYRWLRERRLFLAKGKRVLIVGAGKAGEMLTRDMRRDAGSEYQPVAFVDDDPVKRGREIHGVRVVGTCDDIPAVVAQFGIELTVIALPSATSRQVRRIVEICERAGIPFRILPRLHDLVSGQVGLKELREVHIEDLLGREKVTLDWESIRSGLAGKRVMVTGGGGSIGAELCRQIARLRPERLIVFENSEFNLYRVDLELRHRHPGIPLATVLGDIRDPVAVQQAMQAHRPSVVFHAAAYKHVPMLEGQLRAAVLNNVLGTRVVADAAIRYDCESFVLISTDKAVNPVNVMGVTKRVAEIYCQHLSGTSKTRFVTVRFGNVLGSAGSVVPLFQEQIARGGPVTVTHPEIMRYFMTIPEACQLILQAAAMGKGGEIFVLDMGEPVKIAYLAEQMIRLSGKKTGEDIEIVYTGLRPGEKLYEELFHDQERFSPTSHPKILLARCRATDEGVLRETLAALEAAGREADEARLQKLLQQLVPEYANSEDVKREAVI